jgi:hypothetical protein
VFTMMRKIGQAKAGLAADYTAQLFVATGLAAESPRRSPAR